jgi:hypothetical protein
MCDVSQVPVDEFWKSFEPFPFDCFEYFFNSGECLKRVDYPDASLLLSTPNGFVTILCARACRAVQRHGVGR